MSLSNAEDLKQRPHLVNLNVVLVQSFLVRKFFTYVTPQTHEFDVSSFLVLWHFCLAWSSKVTLFAGDHINQFFNLERDELEVIYEKMNKRRRIQRDEYIPVISSTAFHTLNHDYDCVIMTNLLFVSLYVT